MNPRRQNGETCGVLHASNPVVAAIAIAARTLRTRLSPTPFELIESPKREPLPEGHKRSAGLRIGSGKRRPTGCPSPFGHVRCIPPTATATMNGMVGTPTALALAE